MTDASDDDVPTFDLPGLDDEDAGRRPDDLVAGPEELPADGITDVSTPAGRDAAGGPPAASEPFFPASTHAAPTPAAPTPPAPAAGTDTLAAQIAAALQPLAEQARASDERLGRLEATLADLTKQTGFLPPKLRVLGQKLDDLGTSMADSRCRELLAGVVALLDLVEGARSAFPVQTRSQAGKEARRWMDTLSTRLEQILEDNGLQPIETEGAFDPNLHHAVERTPVDDPERDGTIVAVYRPGFRSDRSVLRYAEVAVGRYEEGDAPAADDGPDEPPTADDANPDTPRTGER